MVLGDPYASIEEYREVAAIDADDKDAEIERDLIAVSRYIDRATGHFLGFNKDAAPVARTYVPRWTTKRLQMGDDYYVSVTSITEDGVALAPSDYALVPRNAGLMPQPSPYYGIERASGLWAAGRTYVVTGVTGWPSVPQGIVSATVELTRILRMESPRASNSINEMNQVLSTSRVAQSIVGELVSQFLNPLVVV